MLWWYWADFAMLYIRVDRFSEKGEKKKELVWSSINSGSRNHTQVVVYRKLYGGGGGGGSRGGGGGGK